MATDDTRMTLGEHLDELRSRLARALIGVGVGMALSLGFGKYLVQVMLWPLAVATGGNPPNLNYLSPPEAFSTYLRVCLLAGAILASPYGLHQMWQFIAVGLYEHERRAVRKFLAPSIGLFLLGVAFFVVIVAPLIVRFFLVFAKDNFLYPPTWGVEFMNRLLLGGKAAAVASAPAGGGGYVRPMLRVGEYIGFISMLSLVFGLAFQTPLVVLFLARSGLVPVAAMRRFRRYVFLVILIISAIVTPADVGSMVALAVPIYCLYEIGLFVAGRKARAAEE